MKTLLFLKINSKIRRGPPALASIQQEDHYVGNIGEVPISHSQEGGGGGGGGGGGVTRLPIISKECGDWE